MSDVTVVLKYLVFFACAVVSRPAASEPVKSATAQAADDSFDAGKLALARACAHLRQASARDASNPQVTLWMPRCQEMGHQPTEPTAYPLLAAKEQILRACAAFDEAERLDGATVPLRVYRGHCAEQKARATEAAKLYVNGLVENARDKPTKLRAQRQTILQQGLDRVKAQVGWLELKVANQPPGIELTLDDQHYSPTWRRYPVEPGEHVFSARAPGFSSERHAFAVGAGGTYVQSVDLRPANLRPAGIAIGAGGLAALGVAAFFGLSALSLVNESDAHCESRERGLDHCTQEGADLRDQAVELQAASIGFAVGGALGVAGGVALYVW